MVGNCGRCLLLVNFTLEETLFHSSKIRPGLYNKNVIDSLITISKPYNPKFKVSVSASFLSSGDVFKDTSRLR